MKISDIYSKLDILEEIKSDLKITSNKLADCEEKIKLHDEHLINNNKKLSDLESKLGIQSNVSSISFFSYL